MKESDLTRKEVAWFGGGDIIDNQHKSQLHSHRILKNPPCTHAQETLVALDLHSCTKRVAIDLRTYAASAKTSQVKGAAGTMRVLEVLALPRCQRRVCDCLVSRCERC